MKTRRLTTILTSAYLSAMLTMSVTPIRSDATLAATIDPMAAQKALQTAVSGLDTAGWLAASTAGAPAASQPTPKIIPNTPPTKTDPASTEELLARMIKFTRAGSAVGSISANFCLALELCDGTKVLPLKMSQSDATDRELYFGLPIDANSKDVFILLPGKDIAYVYLTDKTGKLRAAAMSDKTSTRLITNEKAAEGFKAQLAILTAEAAGLPPTGTPVPGNS